MTDALAIIAPKSIQETAELAQRLSKSSLLPEAYRGKEPDVFMTLLAGSELGLLPVQSLNAFDVIKGRPALKPVAMLALVRSHPTIESIDIIESSATKAVVESKRKGQPRVLRTEFTIEKAQRAGLTNSENYRKWTEEMLGWRCVAIHCRKNHSEIIGGFYSTEEVETFERDITPKAAQGEVVDAQPAVNAVKAAIKAKRVMAIVDDPPKASPPAAPASPPRIDGDGVVLDWPVNLKGTRIDALDAKQLEWCVDKASEKVEAEPESEMWMDRLGAFTAETLRRGAVTP